MLKESTHFQLAPVLFGAGTLLKAGSVVKQLGCSHPYIISDLGIVKTGNVDRLCDALKADGFEFTVWAETKQDCTDSDVWAAAAIGRESKVDCVIGLGGGSALDAAKAISAVIANGDDVIDDIVLYLTGQKDYANKPLPVIEIPTTAGTGSESTFVAVVTSSKLDCKIGLPVPPAYAIVDSELTKTAPASVTGFTGMDALSHANESLTEQKAGPHSDLLAYEAIRLIKENLPKAVANGNDMDARDNLALASNFAGISFNESGVHLGHSIAHALGHLYGIPHGICCANVTPAIVKFAAKTHPEKMRKLGEIMGAEFKCCDCDAGEKSALAVRKFQKEVGVKTFKELGYSLDQILAAKPLVYGEPLSTAYDGVITEEDVAEVLKDAYELGNE